MITAMEFEFWTGAIRLSIEDRVEDRPPGSRLYSKAADHFHCSQANSWLLPWESSVDNFKLFRPVVRMSADAAGDQSRFNPAYLPLLVLGLG
jgi:hypothetical protein